MKKTATFNSLFLAIISLVILSACKKEISTPDEASKALFGQWNYFKPGSVIPGSGTPKFNEGDWVEFSEKGIYIVNEGSKNEKKLNFTISQNDSQGTYKYKINFRQKGLRKKMLVGYVYTVLGDKLYLAQDSPDGYLYIFQRK